MNKKEIAEIRKQFSAERCAITRICGCYVDGEKNKRTSMKEAFLSLPEEEMFKYLDIFKKILSGHIGKNLMNLEYSIAQEAGGTPHAFLAELRATKLKDDELIHELYDRIIKSYISPEPYYIVLLHSVYDVPGKASDNSEMFDASENVYEFIMCSICPVKLSKAGLSYDAEANRVENRVRDWLVDVPAHGFLFPAFNEREADLHGCLYYSKKPDATQEEFVRAVVGTQVAMSAAEQRKAFDAVLRAVVGQGGSVEEILAIYRELQQIIEEAEFASTDALELDKEKARGIFEEVVDNYWTCTAGGRMDDFDTAWDAEVGEKGILFVGNIAAGKALSIDCGNAEIKLSPMYADQVHEKRADDKRYLVIPVEGVLRVNGVEIKGKGEV